METLGMHRVLVILHGITIVICLIILVGMMQYAEHHQNSVVSSSIKNYSYFAVIMYLLSSITIVLYNFYFEDLSNLTNIALQITQGMFYRLAQIFVYIIFVRRLKHSFKQTKYSPSIITYRIFYFLISLFIFIYILKNIFFALILYYNLNQIDFGYIGDIETCVSAVIDLIITTSIIYVFITKLWSLNIDLAYVEHHIQSNDILNDVFIDNNLTNKELSITISSLSSLNDRQKVIVCIMSKIALLSSICLLSTQILIYMNIAMFLNETAHNNSASNFFSNLLLIYWSINSVIASFCVALSFDCAVFYYYGICGYVDALCLRCCYNLTQKKVKSSKKIQRYSLSDHLYLGN